MTTREVAKHIDAFKYWCETNEENGVITIPKFLCEHIVEILDVAIEALKEQRPHGTWRLNEDGNYECSECGIAWKDMPVKDAKPVFKACPWCGIEIRDGEAE